MSEELRKSDSIQWPQKLLAKTGYSASDKKKRLVRNVFGVFND